MELLDGILIFLLALAGAVVLFVLSALAWIVRNFLRWSFVFLFFYAVIICYKAPFQSIYVPEPAAVPDRLFRYEQDNFGAQIKAGFAKRDITPPRFSWLAGYYPPHPGIFIREWLWVKSLALKDSGGNRIVIVSCDLIGLLPDEIEKIKNLVKKAAPNSIFISATHTHSGPDTIGLWGIPPFTGKNEKYMEFLRRQIAEVIDESVSDLSQGTIRFGEGEFSGYVGGREGNPPDPAVSVMQVLLSSGIPVTLVNFASHADVMKSFRISADFPYYLYERLGKLTGGEVIFIPGAIGGVQPKRNGNKNNQDRFLERGLGEDLADRVYKIMEKPIVSENASIAVKQVKIMASLENKKFSQAARIGIVSDLEIPIKISGKISNDLFYAVEVKAVEARLAQIKIGPAEIITIPGELFPSIWWAIKPKMRGKPKFIFGLTNGELGYILSPKDFDSGKHPYHQGMSIGKESGDSVEKALEILLDGK